jgi:isocitrate dehydrogenase
MTATPITVAYGDGIGPEIMEATLHILRKAGANLQVEVIEVGAKKYEQGHTSGLSPDAWESINRTKVLLKAPITTPQGGGYKSLNVTLRKTLGLYANVRPCVAYSPFVRTHHPAMDMVIVRENEEDLYAGIEHRQTNDAYQCLKLLTWPGSEKIVRYAFEYAVRNNRRKVTCMTKDNIMKLADGMFHKVFNEVAKEYPQIEAEHYIIDIGSARIATRPEVFDVIVTLNLYGDIISDIAADVSGSVGLAGSANIGKEVAMFEAIHGSAPDIAGKHIANPSGLLQGALMMLVHIGQSDIAAKIQNAWLCTIEQGIHTADIFAAGTSKKKVTTEEFAEAVISNLGKEPQVFRPAKFAEGKQGALTIKLKDRPKAKKELVGLDVFIDFNGKPEELGKKLEAIKVDGTKFTMLTARGLKVYPDPIKGLDCGDHWRAAFMASPEGGTITHKQVVQILEQASAAGLDFIKTEHLYRFDGERGYSQAQGE